MKRLVILTVLKMFGEVILFSTIAVIVVGIIGYLNKWDTSLEYSDAFFVAGSVLIIGGALSRMAAGQEWGSYRSVHAESFNHMSSSERANFIINASSSLRLAILGLLSGMLLFIISWSVTKFFE